MMESRKVLEEIQGTFKEAQNASQKYRRRLAKGDRIAVKKS